MSSCNARKKGSIHTKAAKNTPAPVINIPVTNYNQPVNNEAKTEKKLHTNNARTTMISTATTDMNRRIQGQPLAKQTIVNFVSEVIPQTNVNPNMQHEKVNWAKIQLCFAEIHTSYSNYVIIIGLARGYQLFLLMEDGNFEEVISVRDVPLKIGHLLPFKAKTKDRFSDQRPLIALYTMENGAPFYTVNFFSLRTCKIVHHINFIKPVMEIDSSSNYLLILINGTISIYEHEGLAHHFSINISDQSTNSSYLTNYSLSENLLAVADLNLDESAQSVGGCYLGSSIDQSSNNQVLNTAKNLTKAVSTISGSLQVSTLNYNSSTNKSLFDTHATTAAAGIISIINLEQVTKNSNHQMISCSQERIAHFCAHSDSPIGHLMFGAGGQLLLTGSITATIFNVFLLHFHPKSSSLASVQHIYTLNRGNTAAKVIESAFSFDNRWLIISTNHGTTHLFALNPYGGSTNSRTHAGKLLNREGKFEKSAGIRTHTNACLVRPHQPCIAKNIKKHPGMKNAIIARTVTSNGLLYETIVPTSLNSSAVLKQRIFSAENFCAWASDNTPTILQNAKRRRNDKSSVMREYGRILSTKFAESDLFTSKNEKYPNTVASILVMNNEGILIEYAIRVVPGKENLPSIKQYNGVSQVPFTNTDEKVASDFTTCVTKIDSKSSELKVKLSAKLQWGLARSNMHDLELLAPPLPLINPLVQLSTHHHMKGRNKQNASKCSWLPFLEVITYNGPHRRMWLGPQFSFNIYRSAEALYDSVPCMTQIDGMQKCCPVLIEKNSSQNVLTQKSDFGSMARIICGSWSSELDYKPLNEEISLVKGKIEAAMNEPSEKSGIYLPNEEREEEQNDYDGDDDGLIFNERRINRKDDNDDDACLLLSGIDL